VSGLKSQRSSSGRNVKVGPIADLMTNPLIDLSNPESWRLPKPGRKRGYPPRDEVDQMFGPELPPDRLEALRVSVGSCTPLSW